MSRYNPERDITRAYVDHVSDWIAEDGEVFEVLRWPGGHRDYALCQARAEFERLVEIICDGTEIIAMRGHHLAFRGVVTEALIGQAVDAIPDGSEYLMLSAATAPDSRIAAKASDGELHRELVEDLRDWMGVQIALGVCPPFWAPDSEHLISRAKGGVEAPR